MTDDLLLRKYIEAYGPAPTMRVIIDAAKRAGIDCHNRAHQFGRMSFEEFGDEILSSICLNVIQVSITEPSRRTSSTTVLITCLKNFHSFAQIT